ncbi:hypothetical protein [Pseudomonas sp. TE24901]
MIRYYSKEGSNLVEVDETDKGPDEGWIEMSGPRPDSADYTAQADGSWSITQETINAKLVPVENAWREEQMPLAQQNVTAIEYGEADIPGTAGQWQAYWLALRKWTDTNPDFPDSSKRPVAPS